MLRVITEYRATGIKGSRGWTLQWVGPNKPTWIVGLNNTCCWYKFKPDAVKAAAVQNGGQA